jgi:hypothetical protein
MKENQIRELINKTQQTISVVKSGASKIQKLLQPRSLNKEINKRIATKAAAATAKAAAKADATAAATRAAGLIIANQQKKTAAAAAAAAGGAGGGGVAAPAAAPAATPAAAPAAAPPAAPAAAPAATPAAAPPAGGGAGKPLNIGPKFLTQDAFEALSAPKQLETLQSLNQQNLRAAGITLEDNKSKAVYEAQYAKYKKYLNEKSLAASQARQATKAADASAIEQFFKIKDPSVDQTLPAVNEMLAQLQAVDLPSATAGLTQKQIDALNKMLPLLKDSKDKDEDLRRGFQIRSTIARAQKVLNAVKALGTA